MSDESGHSEQQSETTTATTTGDKWGDPISSERQAELQGYLDRWEAETDHGEHKGPFDNGPHRPGVLLNGADVSWLAEQSGRDEIGRVPNLHLEGATLTQALLAHASLRAAHLERADLRALSSLGLA